MVGSPRLLRVLAHIRTGKAPLLGHALESGAGHCSPVCVEDYRTPDEAMVC